MLTGNAICEVAHIYPYSMLSPSPATDSHQYDFWDLLKRFWSEDRIQEWRKVIFLDQNRPDKGIETFHNLICLSPDAHAYWTRAYFALKPIQLSDDKKTFDVEFHWMPQYNYSSKVDILTSPQSSEGLDGRSKILLFHFPTKREICSGQKISLTTDDPVTRPLPHPALLEMQWMLHRVAAMSGAAEIYDDFDNDDDEAMTLLDEWDPYKVDEWDPYEEDEWDSYIENDDSNSYEEESLPSMVRPFLKSNIRSDYMPLRPAENLDIKMIGSSQGQ